MAIADVRFYAGKLLTLADCATLHAQAPASARGTGPDAATLQAAQVAKIIEKMNAIDQFLEKVKGDALGSEVEAQAPLTVLETKRAAFKQATLAPDVRHLLPFPAIIQSSL